jgi:glycosyltransferase involved in cell wall biosynthesis
MSVPTISIVLPIYNQADHLEKIVTIYREHLKKINSVSEILLVPNGCTDQSVELCQRLSESQEHVRAIPVEGQGWGVAVQSGLAAAMGEILCYANSARTGPEELVLMLLYAIAYPKTVVKTNRRIRENFRRRLGSLLYNLECRALFDLSYWDINGTPKVFPRSFDRLVHLTRPDDLIDLEFNIICRQMNYPVVEVPSFSTRRHGGKSTTTYLSALRMYWGAYQMWRTQKALDK